MAVDPAFLLENIQRAPHGARADAEFRSQSPFRRDSSIEGNILLLLDEVSHLTQLLFVLVQARKSMPW
jgi:hypothetical protein